jgi:hypothetical protein
MLSVIRFAAANSFYPHAIPINNQPKSFSSFYCFSTFAVNTLKKMLNNDAIVALATPSGAGAIAIIRISGQEAITIEIRF